MVAIMLASRVSRISASKGTAVRKTEASGVLHDSGEGNHRRHDHGRCPGSPGEGIGACSPVCVIAHLKR
ncbi:MAG: hypothetical protein R2705_14730 [Ilumatobacteraceae bacterium]